MSTADRALPASQRRRAPYPVSPAVGPEGQRAREQLLGAAKQLFAEHGYYGTSVEAVARATGRSESAFYQYFQGKLEVFRFFVELLGDDLAAQFAKLPYLTAGADAAREFEEWVSGLGQVLRRHPPVFTDWPLHVSDEPQTLNPAEEYMGRIADSVALAMGDSGQWALRPSPVATTLICVVEWAHITADATAGRRSDDGQLHRTLARIMHGMLYPVGSAGVVEGAQIAGQGWPASLFEGDGLRRAVTARGQNTVERICSAALKAFERRGLAGTSVNDIAALAGVGHGTFYQYWPDRNAVFETLTRRAAQRMATHFATLATLRSVAEVSDWLEAWLDIVALHGTVFHIWTSEMQTAPALWPLAQQCRGVLESALTQLLSRWGRSGALEPQSTATVCWSLLTEFPYTSWVRHRVLERDEIALYQRRAFIGGVLGVDIGPHRLPARDR